MIRDSFRVERAIMKLREFERKSMRFTSSERRIVPRGDEEDWNPLSAVIS